ncbi:MAG: PIN domain-containing protein [Candidatus Micrarchaeaceae archaeon]
MLLDTSAWIEFFIGSAKGKRVREILDKEDCYTSIVSLAEVTNWALKEDREVPFLINTIKQSSNVIELDEDISVLAGKLNFERKRINKKWGMLDSFILASGSIYGLKILTKDGDFRDLPGMERL